MRPEETVIRVTCRYILDCLKAQKYSRRSKFHYVCLCAGDCEIEYKALVEARSHYAFKVDIVYLVVVDEHDVVKTQDRFKDMCRAVSIVTFTEFTIELFKMGLRKGKYMVCTCMTPKRHEIKNIADSVGMAYRMLLFHYEKEIAFIMKDMMLIRISKDVLGSQNDPMIESEGIVDIVWEKLALF